MILRLGGLVVTQASTCETDLTYTTARPGRERGTESERRVFSTSFCVSSAIAAAAALYHLTSLRVTQIYLSLPVSCRVCPAKPRKLVLGPSRQLPSRIQPSAVILPHHRRERQPPGGLERRPATQVDTSDCACRRSRPINNSPCVICAYRFTAYRRPWL